MGVAHGAVFGLLALLLGLAGARADDANDVRLTWETASVVLPGRFIAAEPALSWGLIRRPDTQAQLARLPARAALPAIVYLHGCNGLTPESFADMDAMARKGYVVFAPNSFARLDRRQNCDLRRLTFVGEPRWLRFRFEELERARAEIAKFPWIDQKRVFLFGFSEGGTAAALYDKPLYSGHIITGWNCAARNAAGQPTRFDGLKVPPEIPVLTIVSIRDPVLRSGGHCGEAWLDRPNAISVVLNAPMHWVNQRPDAQQALDLFLAGFAPTAAHLAARD